VNISTLWLISLGKKLNGCLWFFFTDVPLDKEVPIRFWWKSSRSGLRILGLRIQIGSDHRIGPDQSVYRYLFNWKVQFDVRTTPRSIMLWYNYDLVKRNLGLKTKHSYIRQQTLRTHVQTREQGAGCMALYLKTTLNLPTIQRNDISKAQMIYGI